MSRLRSLLRLTAAVLLPATALAAPSQAPTKGAGRARGTVGAAERTDPAAQALLDKLKSAQETTKSMTANFRQVKEDDLFAEPSIQTGRFTFGGPDKFRWDYEKPEPVVVVVTKDEFLRHLPQQKLLRRMDLSKNRRRVFNYFGIGSDIEVLQRHFDLKKVASGAERPGTEKLELRGKRRRVQKRLALLEMWIDTKHYLPNVIKVTMADGGTTLWEFTDLKVNATLPADAFTIAVPKGTVVQSEDDPRSAMIDDVLAEEEPGGASGAPGAPGQ
jgi:outer membrane lipoprotein-sorting protein